VAPARVYKASAKTPPPAAVIGYGQRRVVLTLYGTAHR